MSLSSDHKFVVDGDFINFQKGFGAGGTLDPQQTLTVTAQLMGPQVSLSVESLDFLTQTRTRFIGNPAEGQTVDEYQCVPVRVELFEGDSSMPAETRTTPSGWLTEQHEVLEETHATGAAADESTTWTLRVTNTSHAVVACQLGIGGVYSRLPRERRDISLRVLNHAFKVVIEALTFRASLHANQAVISFGEELAAYTRNLNGSEFTPITHDLGSFTAEGELFPLDVKLTSGQALLDAMNARWSALDGQLRAELGPATGNGLLTGLIKGKIAENDAWRKGWTDSIGPDFLTLKVKAVATDIQVSADILWFNIDIADIEHVAADIYLAFEPTLVSGRTLILSPAEFTGGVAELAADLGILPDAGPLIESFAPIIDAVSVHLGRYLAEALLRMARGPGVFFTAGSNGLSVMIECCADPDAALVHSPAEGAQGAKAGGLGGLLAAGNAGPAGNGGGPVGVDPDLGAIPPEFVIGNDQAALQRLDQIETIVVLMMENRSFDHMLGYLRMAKGDHYEGLTGTESNPPPPPVSGPVTVRRASSDAVIIAGGHPVTQIMVSPEHGFDHVRAQVNNGSMDGFARDLATKAFNQYELAMVYYTAAELPVYDWLAANYCVADHWFAAHAGSTWPNRWATISGTTPVLDNFSIDDPRLGFMNEATIFDALRAEQIPFTYFEHNVSVLRMFNEYRTDDTYVVPFDPPDGDTSGTDFRAVAKRGELPPVVFIDPSFVDVPPVALATDDAPPANLKHGQGLVADVVRTLVESPQWPRTLLILTYDEHGGFFDHVPPPGTQFGPPEWRGVVPRIHPDGADNLGVRVPTFIVSPWVSAGAVTKTVFDHTSILKTILVRHRARIHKDWFTRFGPRVNAANHAGLALDQDHARADAPPPVPTIPALRHRDPSNDEPFDPTTRARPTFSSDGDESDFRVSLCRAMVPRTP